MAAKRGSVESPRREYTIRKATERRDLWYLARQWHHYFGAEYTATRLPTPLADVLGWVDEEDAPLAVCALVAEHDGVHVGGALATLESHEEIVDELPSGRFDAAALAGNRNAYLVFGAVDKAWRGHGIGRRLFRRRLDWARAHGADMVVSFGWERRKGRTSRPLFEGYGFIPIQQFPGFYASEESGRTSCPDCGVWPSDDAECSCGMTFWALDGEAI